MINAKNQLQELLASLGLPIDLAVYTSTQAGADCEWRSTVVVTLPERPLVTGFGAARSKRQAEVAAAEQAMASLAATGGRAGQNWAQIYAEAQAGDALLKLVGYLVTGATSPEERSRWLQLYESDAWLAVVFDRWLNEGDPDLGPYGPGLGEKNKSTMIEALLWRRYGAHVLGPDAIEVLRERSVRRSRNRQTTTTTNDRVIVLHRRVSRAGSKGRLPGSIGERPPVSPNTPTPSPK